MATQVLDHEWWDAANWLIESAVERAIERNAAAWAEVDEKLADRIEDVRWFLGRVPVVVTSQLSVIESRPWNIREFKSEAPLQVSL